MRVSRALAIVAVAAMGWSTTAMADLTVDFDLGLISTNQNLVGDTTGGSTNAGQYAGRPATWFYNGGEHVYQFTLNDTYTLSLTQNASGGTDHDQFLLSGLTTSFNGTVDQADDVLSFVDESGSFGLVGPGTYYISVDGWGSGSASFAEGAYDMTLGVELYVPPTAPPCTDLGIAGADGDLFTITTDGSNFDTEIGLFDSLGALIEIDDDDGEGTRSLITRNLAEGTYYVAAGGFNTTFAAGWSVSGGTAAGDLIFDVNGLTDMRTTAAGDVNWYCFEVVPEPGTALLLAFGVVGLIRRRR